MTSVEATSPPNIGLGRCCLYCWYGSFDMDKHGEEFAKCHKFNVRMAMTQICGDHQVPSSILGAGTTFLQHSLTG